MIGKRDLRKVLLTMVMTLLLFSCIPIGALANTAIKVKVDGRELVLDQSPVIIDGRTLVPLRAIFEALNTYVDYNQSTQTINAFRGNTVIKLKLGSNNATVNNVSVTLDVPAQVVNGRTLVPVRFVSEALGEEVTYNPSTREVTVSTKVQMVTNVNVSLSGNTGDARDVKVGFTVPSDQSRIDHYRVLVVKTSKAATFNVSTANQISFGNYTYVMKDSTRNKEITLTSTRDTDGELIIPNTSYTVFVLSVSNSGTLSQNTLVKASATVTLTYNGVAAASNVLATDVSEFGDGRDLRITFTKASDESNIANYRILVVRESSVASFNINSANAVTSSNYTTVWKTGSNITYTLTSSSRDVNGQLIQNDIPYKIYILSVADTVSKKENSLSQPSSTITLTNKNKAAAVTNLRLTDVSDYGDGRDLEVTFNKIFDETVLSQYRVFVVRSSEAANFDITKAKSVTLSNYTTIYKTGSNIKQILSATTRDVNGLTIQSGVPYKIFVLSVGDTFRGYGDSLSSGSNEVTLTSNPADNKVYNLTVRDVGDYNDGRDLEVSFTIPSNEHRVSHYRVMVVKATDVNSFNLSVANSVAAGNYTVVSKTGSNITTTLSASTRDVYGALIQNNIAYRVFVLSVGDQANSYLNYLSSSSASITLTNNIVAAAVTNLQVVDVSDFGDGRDLRVSFNRVSDESKISQYRIMVIKSAQASSFDVITASSIPASNYTAVAKTGSNISTMLSSTARDVHGDVIREGVAYRVYVLSVSNGGNINNNALSSSSIIITLGKNMSTLPATSVVASDINDFGDGRDMRVTFTKAADETRIAEYRIMIVKAAQADTFSLAYANLVSSANYTAVAKTGSNITRNMTATTRDVQGDLIQSGVAYRVFVLSVSSVGDSQTNALSTPSAAVTLNSPAVGTASNIIATDISNNGNGSDLQVSFTKPASETGIAYYAVMVVKEANASSFNLATANGVPASNYTRVDKTGSNITTSLSASARDVNGDLIINGRAYRIFILSIADGQSASVNALSAGSNSIILADKTLTWNGTFNEAPVPANDGSINTTVTVTLSGDTFANEINPGVHVLVNNLPNGLTLNVTRTSATVLTFSISGNATAHQQADSINNLTISLTDAAFVNSGAAGVTNSVKSDLQINFID